MACCSRNRPSSLNLYAEAKWQTCLRSPLYLLFRWVVAGLFIAANVISFQEHFAVGGHWGNYFIYLTNWGINLCLVTSLYGGGLISSRYIRPKHSGSDFSLNVYWCLHNVTLVFALVITISYWGLLYSPDLYIIDAANIATHLCNSIIMLMDFCVLVHPIRWHQPLYSLGLGVVYAVFTWIYHLAGGENRDGKPYIYSSMNWAEPTKALIMVAVILVMVLIVQILVYGLQYAWLLVHRKCAPIKPLTGDIHMMSV